MKIFVVGMPKSGRTTVAKALCQLPNYRYIDATSWVKSTFRPQKDGEHPQQYDDELHRWYLNRTSINPNTITDQVYDSMDAYEADSEVNLNYVIDGISSPRDLVRLFEPMQDMIVFLNRTNNSAEFKDYENIGVSVMRDYCFWLASADNLNKENWHEYNFSIPGEESDWIKQLGQKNSVFIVKSINRVISHLKERLLK